MPILATMGTRTATDRHAPGTAPRGRYEKGRAKRSLILDKALEVFGEAGYRGATIREIAARCGMSHQAVMHYFASKDDLLLAALHHRDDRLRRFFDDEGGLPPGEMVALARDNLRHPGHVELYTVAAAEAADPSHPAHDYYERYQRGIVDSLARWLAARPGVRLRAGFTPQSAARVILAVQDGLQLQWLYERSGDQRYGDERSTPEIPTTPEVMEALFGALVEPVALPEPPAEGGDVTPA